MLRPPQNFPRLPFEIKQLLFYIEQKSKNISNQEVARRRVIFEQVLAKV